MDKISYFLISDNGMRIDKWLMRNFAGVNNALAQKLIRTGQIRVDSKRVKFSTILIKNQRVRVPTQLIKALASTLDTEIYKKSIDLSKYKEKIDEIINSILYKDDNFIIINKKAGLAVQGGTKINFSLNNAFEALRFGNAHNPHIIHRIDKDTSGILVLARNVETSAYMHEVFKNQRVQKEYLCLAYPIKKITQDTINAPLIKNNNQTQIVEVNYETGKEALTNYKVLDLNNNYKVGLLNVRPLTGRMHQIRVHLATILGASILGDYKYGYKTSNIPDFKAQRLYLHAHSIEFQDIQGKLIKIKAPLNSDFIEALNYFALNYSSPNNHGNHDNPYSTTKPQ